MGPIEGFFVAIVVLFYIVRWIFVTIRGAVFAVRRRWGGGARSPLRRPACGRWNKGGGRCRHNRHRRVPAAWRRAGRR